MNIKQASAERFGENAAKYAASKGHGDAASLRALVDLAQPSPDDRLLDVATGAGHTALAFAPHLREVVAYDLSQGMLDQTLKSAAERGLSNVAGALGDAEDISLPDDSFEIAACRIAAHHFPDQPKFFREAFRVLKPDGKLVFVDNYGPGTPELALEIEEIERLRDWTHHRTWTLEDIRNHIESAGFRIVAEQTGTYDEAGPIDFDDWCRRIGTPQESVAELRRRFLSAGQNLRNALHIEVNGDAIGFKLPKLTILALKP